MKLNHNNTSLKVSAGLPSQFPADAVPQVAFSGRSNVGKSSLINSLLGRKSLARVSPMVAPDSGPYPAAVARQESAGYGVS